MSAHHSDEQIEAWAVERWRRSEGDSMRRGKGKEHEPDPDWSMEELSRDKEALVREFFDWWADNWSDGDNVDVAFASWSGLRWHTPLSMAARGLLMHRVREHQREPQPVEHELKVPGVMRAPDGRVLVAETLEAIFRANGIRVGPGVRTMPRAPEKYQGPAITEDRLPYKEPAEGAPAWAAPEPDVEVEYAVGGNGDERPEPEEEARRCRCGAALGPLDDGECGTCDGPGSEGA